MKNIFEKALEGCLKEKDFPLDINERDNEQRSILHWACSGKHLDLVESILKLDANVIHFN
jgi:hypothetical protein